MTINYETRKITGNEPYKDTISNLTGYAPSIALIIHMIIFNHNF